MLSLAITTHRSLQGSHWWQHTGFPWLFCLILFNFAFRDSILWSGVEQASLTRNFHKELSRAVTFDDGEGHTSVKMKSGELFQYHCFYSIRLIEVANVHHNVHHCTTAWVNILRCLLCTFPCWSLNHGARKQEETFHVLK